MYYFFLVIVLSLHLGCSLRNSDTLQKHGSHSLTLEKSNNSVQRPVRCTPCEQDTNLKKPVSNHLDSEYRGNGADNLGYDWSPMAWGGPAFPKRSKFPMGGMGGRDGRMMSGGRESNQGSIQIICDTCRAYWSGNRRDGGSPGRDGNRGRQFDSTGSLNYYGSQPGYRQGNSMRLPDDFEARVMSPTVGVLVKPGSRIAYIPSRSGEMYWDGVSGGGTRWDGFSNGISWIGGNSPEWDRSDSEPRNGPDPLRPGGDYSYSSNPYGSWDNQKRPSNWDNSGGYYFTNGVPNNIDPQWRDRGYASNWHYGSTNQNGWNGNSMKWNYGGKQWVDNDRAANRFYFNSPQDRTYEVNDGQHPQYGNQYPNYQPVAGYPSRPPWPTRGGYRPNDRFPADFQQGSYGGSDKNRPWDYTSRDPFEYRRPGKRPQWTRPGPSYPAPGNQVDNYEKISSSYDGYDKTSPTDKNDFDKPWNKPSGYGFSKPGGNFPYGGNRYPAEDGSSGRPGYPGGYLFAPSDSNRHPGNPSLGSGENGPTYLGNRKPGGYPSSGNQINTFPGEVSRPSVEYPGDKRPSIIYTGARPSITGSSSGGHPGGGSLSGGYPLGGYPPRESSSGGYPGGGSLPGGYPGGGSLPGGYPGGGSPSGGYPGGGRPPGGYPGGGSPSGGYPGGGSPSGGYPGGGSPSGGYPGGGSPSGGYPGGGSPSGGYPGGGSPSGGYPGGGSPSGGYPGGGSPSGGYPGGGSLSGGYPGGGSPSGGYPSTESSVGGFPSSGGFPGTYIDRPGSGGSSYPSGVAQPGGYFTGNTYPKGGTRPGSRPDKFYGGGDSSDGYPGQGSVPYPRPSSYPVGGGSSNPTGSFRPVFYPDGSYSSSGYFGGSRPTGYPGTEQGQLGQGHHGESSRPDGYLSSNKPNYFTKGPPSYPGTGLGGNKNPPKGYYTGFITELNGDDRQSQYGGRYPNYFGSSYPGDKNFYPDKNRDKYYSEGSYISGYPSGEKNRYPEYSEDRYSSGGNRGDGYPAGNSDRGGDKFYYGQGEVNSKYPGKHPSNHRYPDNGGDESNNDKNSWNYGENERKDGIYRRSGGSYPLYKGGQYYTSSYLATMSTTAGSTQAGTEPKTQSMTKADEVTQATSVLS